MKKLKFISLCCIISILTANFVFENINATSGGKILYVGGSGLNNYTKIQYAIDNASNGDTIFVYSGTYYENVVVDKTINLVGEHLNTTTIIGDVTDTIWMTGNSACIKGFTIRDNKSQGAGIRLTWDHHVVENCNIFGVKYGILITSSSSNLITNCTFRNNEYGIIITGCKCARGSTNSIIYHNNFINNDVQARDEWSNIWNSKTGNYWSDYAGNDENNDGIGDVPYNISGGFNKDYAPIMKPIDIVPPIVRLVFPNGGEFLAGNVTIKWKVWDDCDANPKIDIEYSMDNNGWHTVAIGLSNTTEYMWDISALPVKKNYSLGITATDMSGNKGRDASNGTFTIISPPHTDFIKPKKGFFYFNNKEMIPLPGNLTICIGAIKIQVNAFSDIGIEKVLFYLDSNLTAIKTSEPYEWVLDKKTFGKHEVKVVAYDNAENEVSKRANIWVFNL